MDNQDHNEIKSFIESFRNQLNDLSTQLSEVNTKVDRIERGMYGDNDNDQKGIIEVNKSTLQRIKRLETFRDRIAIIITTSSAGIGFLTSWLWKILFNHS